MIQLEKSRLPAAGEWVEFDSQRFRRLQRQRDNAPELDHGVFPVQDEHRQLKTDLALRIAKLVHVERMRDLDPVTQESLIRAVQDTVTALESVQREWIGFLRRLVRIDVARLTPSHFFIDNEPSRSRFEEDARLEIIRKTTDSIVSEIFDDEKMAPLGVSLPVTAELLSGDLEAARQSACMSVVQSVSEVVDRMMRQLDVLVERSVCGMITRLPKQTCKFSYRYRKISLNNIRSTHTHTHITHAFTSTLIDEYTFKTHVDVLTCFREHHLIHVIETDPFQGVTPIPEFHSRVIESIPAWLRPSTGLVEGTVVGIVEGDRFEKCKELEVSKTHVMYIPDPALVLGQHVLTAWGPEELGAEEAEKGRRRSKESVLKRYWSSLTST